MNVGVAGWVGGNHVSMGIICQGATLNVAHDGIPFGHGGHLGIQVKISPAWLADTAERQVFFTKGLTEGYGNLGKGRFVACPAHEVVVFALVVEHAPDAEVADGHNGGVEQSGWWTPAAARIRRFLGKSQAWFGFAICLGPGHALLVLHLGSFD